MADRKECVILLEQSGCVAVYDGGYAVRTLVGERSHMTYDSIDSGHWYFVTAAACPSAGSLLVIRQKEEPVPLSKGSPYIFYWEVVDG
jgi:hypothetical protein